MISSHDFTWNKFKFPSGEMHVRLSELIHHKLYIDILWEFENNEELVELILLMGAIRSNSQDIRVNLTIPYLPFSRQDRVATRGDSFSLLHFAEVLKLLNFNEINTNDLHSPVILKLLPNVKETKHKDIFSKYIKDPNCWIISPDKGAIDRAYDLVKLELSNNLPIVFKKVRNPVNGEITGLTANIKDLRGLDCYIADDICDGGRTFIEVAKILKQYNPGKIILLVTHGLFTKGLSVFDGLIDNIYTSKGQIK